MLFKVFFFLNLLYYYLCERQRGTEREVLGQTEILDLLFTLQMPVTAAHLGPHSGLPTHVAVPYSLTHHLVPLRCAGIGSHARSYTWVIQYVLQAAQAACEPLCHMLDYQWDR